MRRERSEGLAALLDSPDMPLGRAGPYALRRQLGATKPISNREPSLAHLAASNSADVGAVSQAMAHARSQPEQKPPKPDQPKQAAANSPQAKAAASQQQPFAGFAPSSSAGSQHASSAAEVGGVQNRFLSPFSQPQASGLDPLDAFAHLPEGLRIQLQAPGAEDMSRTNSLVYNQVNPCMLCPLAICICPMPLNDLNKSISQLSPILEQFACNDFAGHCKEMSQKLCNALLCRLCIAILSQNCLKSVCLVHLAMLG